MLYGNGNLKLYQGTVTPDQAECSLALIIILLWTLSVLTGLPGPDS